MELKTGKHFEYFKPPLQLEALVLCFLRIFISGKTSITQEEKGK
jgi:hypothetical protein